MASATTSTIRDQLARLSEPERAELLRELQDTAPATEVRKRTPLDASEATQERFIADLVSGDRVSVTDYVGTTLWFIGHDNARGPQGGVYLYGRCVVGVKSAARKGMLKIASRRYNEFKQGGTAEAWVRFDGDTKDTLVGLLANHRPHATRRAKTT